MPFPRAVAHVNKHLTNRVLGHLAGRVGAFAWIGHTGRRSGAAYRTPIMAFRHGDTVLIALTYGPRTDWVRNIQASGTTVLTTRHGALTLTDPQLIEGDPRSLPYPGIVPVFLAIMRVRHALRLTVICTPALRQVSTSMSSTDHRFTDHPPGDRLAVRLRHPTKGLP